MRQAKNLKSAMLIFNDKKVAQATNIYEKSCCNTQIDNALAVRTLHNGGKWENVCTMITAVRISCV